MKFICTHCSKKSKHKIEILEGHYKVYVCQNCGHTHDKQLIDLMRGLPNE